MVQVKWLCEAQQDLKEIHDYISLDSAKYATLQLDRIIDRVSLLERQPEIGKVVLELARNDIREIIEGNYRIIYRIVDKSNIHILMIHHGARDLSRRF